MGEDLPHDRRQRGPGQFALPEPSAACRFRRIQQLGVASDIGPIDRQFEMKMRERMGDDARKLFP